MPKFRKKPVIVEAEQFDGSVESAQRLSLLYASNVWPDFSDKTMEYTGRMCVNTLEGIVYANAGDWIITDVAGERYPCKPLIFAATYEKVDDA